MKIVLTGSSGMLGWHLRCRLLSAGFGNSVVALDRASFNDDEVLGAALSEVSVVVHLAGINRDDDEIVEYGNVAIAERLVEFLDSTNALPQLLYSNSIHRGSDTPYGRGKSVAGSILRKWADSVGCSYTELILPHIFGECGKPFYNSVVSTFCHQIVAGDLPAVNPAGSVELLHAQDVCERILTLIDSKRCGEVLFDGTPFSVIGLANRLKEMWDGYHNRGVIPDLRKKIDLQLFNVLRANLYPDFFPRGLDLKVDDRGSLFEAIKTENGGQAFLSSTKPGSTRGNHFHLTKLERFLVVKGSAVIRIRKLFSDKVDEFIVSGDSPVFIDIPTLHTHNISNVGDGELITLFWSQEIFDPDVPDTFYERV